MTIVKELFTDTNIFFFVFFLTIKTQEPDYVIEPKLWGPTQKINMTNRLWLILKIMERLAYEVCQKSYYS